MDDKYICDECGAIIHVRENGDILKADDGQCYHPLCYGVALAAKMGE